MCLLDITQTRISRRHLSPIWYLPFIGQYAVLAAVDSMRTAGYDRFFAWYQLITLLVWRYGEAISPSVTRRLPRASVLCSALNRYPFIAARESATACTTRM